MAAQLKLSKEHADYIAYHDHLTGLANRHFFVTSLERAIVEACRRDVSPEHRDAAAIIRAILSKGRTFGVEIVAQGVETQAQAEFLMREGGRYAQGFHYRRPIGRAELLP
jgi:predicted signal transduction protein with EAL and GGDEF domain